MRNIIHTKLISSFVPKWLDYSKHPIIKITINNFTKIYTNEHKMKLLYNLDGQIELIDEKHRRLSLNYDKISNKILSGSYIERSNDNGMKWNDNGMKWNEIKFYNHKYDIIFDGSAHILFNGYRYNLNKLDDDNDDDDDNELRF
jgi:hypothetical protein